MYRLILVPLDGSRFGELALPPALSISRKTGAKVHLLTVAEPLSVLGPGGWPQEMQDWSSAYLDRVRDRVSARAGGSVAGKALSGHPAEVIQEEAERDNVDLVVMASHGRGGLSRAWLGSVTDTLIRHWHRPVLVVRAEESEPASGDEAWRFSRILLPLDGSPVSETVLEHAVELGALFGASFHLLRVIPFPRDFTSSYPPDLMRANQIKVEEARAQATSYLDGHARRLQAEGLEVDTAAVVVSWPAHGILAEAESSGCDFIAMGTHGRGKVARTILGSTTDKVLRGANLPLLLLHASS
jgi:nucleotide-binding universal stress UspA family protein